MVEENLNYPRVEKSEYRHEEIEEFREELEKRIKREVFLEIEANHYREDFYEESPVNSLLLWNKKDKGIEYNVGLYKKYKKESIHENIRRIMAHRVELGSYNRNRTIFKPKEYNEEVALRCGLMPFKYVGDNREVELVMLSVYPDYVFFMKPKLDAYQAIMSRSISRRNVLESNEEYFKQIVGKEITEEVKKRLKKEVPPKRQTKNESKRETISYYNCVTF